MNLQQALSNLEQLLSEAEKAATKLDYITGALSNSLNERDETAKFLSESEAKKQSFENDLKFEQLALRAAKSDQAVLTATNEKDRDIQFEKYLQDLYKQGGDYKVLVDSFREEENKLNQDRTAVSINQSEHDSALALARLMESRLNATASIVQSLTVAKHEVSVVTKGGNILEKLFGTK